LCFYFIEEAHVMSIGTPDFQEIAFPVIPPIQDLPDTLWCKMDVSMI
jgi:hypothetical protein